MREVTALLTDLARRPPFEPAPLEEIAERAGHLRRRRRRRRRTAAASGLVAVAVVAAVAGVIVTRPKQTGPVTVIGPVPSPGPGSAGARAWRGDGNLAVVSGGQLHVVGNDGREVTVTGPGAPSEPAWSPDGKWVAFLRTPAAPRSAPYHDPPARLWVARAGGGGHAHPLTPAGLSVEQFAWSPTADSVAFLATHGDSVTSELSLAAPTSPSTRTLERGRGDYRFAWSPSGQQLAVGATTTTGSGAPARGVVLVVPVDGGRSHVVTSSANNGFEVASWWPNGKGLIFWLDRDFSASIAADGLPLQSLDLATGRRTTLATTLTYANWLAWSPDGTTLAVVAGNNRSVWNGGKHIELCTFPAGTCTRLAQPADTISLDPAWTASGNLVVTHAPGTTSESEAFPPGLGHVGDAPYSGRVLSAWQAASQLATAEAAGGNLHQLTATGPGSHDAEATSGGLLYVRNGQLWYLATGATRPFEIVPSLSPAGPYNPSYYGYIPWYQDLAWHP